MKIANNENNDNENNEIKYEWNNNEMKIMK